MICLSENNKHIIGKICKPSTPSQNLRYVNPQLPEEKTKRRRKTQAYGGRASPCKSTGGGCMGFFGEIVHR